MMVKETDAFRLQRPGIQGKNNNDGSPVGFPDTHPARFTCRQRQDPGCSGARQRLASDGQPHLYEPVRM